MRHLRRLWILALTFSMCAPVTAREPGPTLRIEAPTELRVGARVTVPVIVDWEAAGNVPLILSAHAEGRALDVVKARLLRADAVDPDANPLRFDVPLLAAAPGVAVLNVSVVTYRCAFRCESVRAKTSKQILVREP